MPAGPGGLGDPAWPTDFVPGPRTFDAVAVGEPLVAFIANDGAPLPQSLTYRRIVTGAEYNVAVGLARLGHRTLFAGRVGHDPFGAVIEADARANGLELRLTRDDGATTGVLARDVQATVPTTVQYARSGSAGSRLSVADLGGMPWVDTRILHVTGITAVLSASCRDAVHHAMSAARDAGVCVSFDPNVRRRIMGDDPSRAAVIRGVELSHLLLAGADELQWLAGAADLDASVRWALDRGPGLVIVKDGARGAWVSDGRHRLDVPAVAVHAVDPVGAGDGFAAGLLSALLRDRPLSESMEEAARVAALVVAAPGDTQGLPGPELRDAFRGAPGVVLR